MVDSFSKSQYPSPPHDSLPLLDPPTTPVFKKLKAHLAAVVTPAEQKRIDFIIRIGQEILSLPYAGFLHKVLEKESDLGRFFQLVAMSIPPPYKLAFFLFFFPKAPWRRGRGGGGGGMLKSFLAVVLLSASVERFFVSRMRDLKKKKSTSPFGGSGDTSRTKKKNWCYHPHWSRDSLSPICGISSQGLRKIF